jgi:hypothetical protein
LPSHPPFLKSGLKPEVQPGVATAKRIGIEHVLDWSAMEQFVAAEAGQSPRLYYAEDLSKFDDLPPNLLSTKSPERRRGCRSYCRNGRVMKRAKRAKKSRRSWNERTA